MTDTATRLFYVNHPNITAGSAFTSNCPSGGEKTVVLGCYIGHDGGIYVYKVTDTRLNGVEQVTAAHEMLHAAYQRLSGSERSSVDAMLTSYYQHGLTDQRVKDTIAAYKISEPKDVVNEMHSIFGTELAELPAPLESYYARYFTDRSKVAGFTASYQAEFTTRQTQVAEYDAQLKGMKQQISTNETEAKVQKSAIDAAGKQLEAQRASGQFTAYNSGVPAFNASVDRYNQLLTDTKNLINQYNAVVETRNKIALEEQQLTAELSASSLPAN